METSVEIVWKGERRYRGGPVGGAALTVDGDREVAPSPVDAVVAALAACAAIDVVDILEKRRTPAAALRVRAEFTRAATTPRRLTAVGLHFTVTTDAARAQVERALELSFAKYCSVSASLAPDIERSWTLALEAAEAVTS